MTKEEAIKTLKDLQDSDDAEVAHMAADNVLCNFLATIGHLDVALEFEKIEPKWCA